MSDREAFDQIVRDTHVSIRAYIAGMGIAPHEVDDVAQEVYLALFRGLQKMPAEATALQWLKGIARNLCLNHIRKSARRGRLHREALAELLADAQSACQQQADRGEMDAALQGCYERLPDDSKRLLTLRYRDEQTSQSIARHVNSTAQAVRVALHRIRNSLKHCISKSLSREGWA